jgi:hypothetical protein
MGVLSGVLSNVLSGVLSDVLSSVLSDVLSSVLPNVLPRAHTGPESANGLAWVRATTCRYAAGKRAPGYGTTRDSAGQRGTAKDSAGQRGTARDSPGQRGTARDNSSRCAADVLPDDNAFINESTNELSA